MTGHAPAGPPTLHRHLLGRDLRKSCQELSLRIADAAGRVGIRPRTLSRTENGQAPAKPGYLTVLLDPYGIDSKPNPGRVRLRR
jgi:hypothetical protein